jgi:hypothetical protein
LNSYNCNINTPEHDFGKEVYKVIKNLVFMNEWKHGRKLSLCYLIDLFGQTCSSGRILSERWFISNRVSKMPLPMILTSTQGEG